MEKATAYLGTANTQANLRVSVLEFLFGYTISVDLVEYLYWVVKVLTDSSESPCGRKYHVEPVMCNNSSRVTNIEDIHNWINCRTVLSQLSMKFVLFYKS